MTLQTIHDRMGSYNQRWLKELGGARALFDHMCSEWKDSPLIEKIRFLTDLKPRISVLQFALVWYRAHEDYKPHIMEAVKPTLQHLEEEGLVIEPYTKLWVGSMSPRYMGLSCLNHTYAMLKEGPPTNPKLEPVVTMNLHYAAHGTPNLYLWDPVEFKGGTLVIDSQDNWLDASLGLSDREGDMTLTPIGISNRDKDRLRKVVSIELEKRGQL